MGRDLSKWQENGGEACSGRFLLQIVTYLIGDCCQLKWQKNLGTRRRMVQSKTPEKKLYMDTLPASACLPEHYTLT